MKSVYDIGITGGGLAGLALSIQLSKAGYRVILFEKEHYPFHRVCGEYISMESWDFLTLLGLDLKAMKAQMIKQLQLSGKNGKVLKQKLPLGGFGISRYALDSKLAEVAKRVGVVIEENTKVSEIIFIEDHFIMDAGERQYQVKVAAGSFGKRSNLDIKWRRSFAAAAGNKLNNYIGVKYHVRASSLSPDTIALHAFDNGYCGLCKIEGDRYNLCYLTTADNLQKSGSIKRMEESILAQNPQIRKIFSETQRVAESPVTISQISFDKKSQVEDHVLMIGDAAGMITPLCGNGMSMALHGSKLAAEQIDLFLKGFIARKKMEEQYIAQWKKHFDGRLLMGRRIQRLLSSERLTYFFISVGQRFPGLIKYLIKKTHGKPF